MAKYRSIKNSLLGGEISPAAFGRTDLPIYNHACKTLRNMIPMTSGGAYRRPGTIFGTSLAESTDFAPAIFPFVESDGRISCAMFGHKNSGSFRPYVTLHTLDSSSPNKTALVSTRTDTIQSGFTHHSAIVSFNAATVDTANDKILIATWPYPNGTKIRLVPGVSTLPTGLLSTVEYYVINTVANTSFQVSLTPGGSAVDITAAGSGTIGIGIMFPWPFEVALNSNKATYGQLDYLSEMQVIQLADTLWTAHPFLRPGTALVTSSAVDYGTYFRPSNVITLTGYEGHSIPFQIQNTTSSTVNFAANTGFTTITGSGMNWTAEHVGVVYKILSGGSVGYAEVVAYTSSSSVTAYVWSTIPAGAVGSPVTTWCESAWSDLRGWPRAIGYFQNRIVYGGSKSFPDTLWFSGLNYFSRMDDREETDPTSATGVEPFSVILNSRTIDQIQWISTGDKLMVGTTSSEWVLDRVDQAGGWEGANIVATKQSDFGSSYVAPSRAGNELLYPSTRGEIKALVFNDSESSYVSESTQGLFNESPKRFFSSYSELGAKFRRIAWDESRNTLWCVDHAGNLTALTRNRSLGLNLWSSHRIGGYDSSVTGSGVSYSSSTTIDPAYWLPSGSVLSVCVTPNKITSYNDVWLVVRRKINNAWQYHIERITGGPPSSDTAQRLVDDEFYLDSTIYKASTGGAATYTWTGFDHLEGKTVSGVASSANGLFTCSATAAVSSGSLTLATAYPPNYATINYMVSFGLSFDSIVEPVRLEAGSVIGTAQGAIKRSHKATIRFYKTLSAKVGRDASNLETLVFREGSTPLNESPDYFTGDKLVLLDSDYDRDGLVYILQDQPLPFSVVSIILEGMTYD